MDGENVQPGATSEGAVSAEGQQLTTAQPQVQPSIEERVAQLVAAEVEKIKPRIYQSVNDRFANKYNREVAEAQRRAQLAEEEAASLRASVNEYDPQAAELASLRAERKVNSTLRVEENKMREAAANVEAVNQRLYAILDKAGIDRNDKGIDWASDVTDYHEGISRFHESVAKIKGEKVLAAALKKTELQARDLEGKLRKDLGLDSVDTSIGVGGSGEFAGIPRKIEELRRFIAGMSQTEYEKIADKVTEMRRRNLIT